MYMYIFQNKLSKHTNQKHLEANHLLMIFEQKPEQIEIQASTKCLLLTLLKVVFCHVCVLTGNDCLSNHDNS